MTLAAGQLGPTLAPVSGILLRALTVRVPAGRITSFLPMPWCSRSSSRSARSACLSFCEASALGLGLSLNLAGGGLEGGDASVRMCFMLPMLLFLLPPPGRVVVVVGTLSGVSSARAPNPATHRKTRSCDQGLQKCRPTTTAGATPGQRRRLAHVQPIAHLCPTGGVDERRCCARLAPGECAPM